MQSRIAASLTIAGLVATSSAAAHGRPPHKPRPAEFDAASICVERNATDGDTEIVMTAIPGDEGLKHFRVRSPDGRRVFSFDSPDPTVLGIREFALESPEPEGDRILAAYPPGNYEFAGKSHTGAAFLSNARLSHRMPNETVIIAPATGAEVPLEDLIIQWSGVPGVSEYVLELENESADPEQSLSINLPPEATTFLVPAAWLVQGSEYQVGLATIAPNCNVVFVETTFTTAK